MAPNGGRSYKGVGMQIYGREEFYRYSWRAVGGTNVYSVSFVNSPTKLAPKRFN